MRHLVTGAAGFVGSHLIASLRAEDAEVTGTALDAHGFELEVVDVRDREAVDRVVERIRPDRVFHLAAQSSAALSWRDPALTYEVNVTGTHNLLDSLRRHCPGCRILLACTSDEYGKVAPKECPIEESAPLRPVSPYATSKLAQEWVGRMFFEGFGLHIVITRAFMHIGPGQPPSFATADWARQIARAEAGLGDPRVAVGNLDLAREFGDVRDVVRAYRMVLESGEPGEAYNVATGDARRLGEALDILRKLAAVEVGVHVEGAKIRPADPPLLQGSAAKLERLAGWKPEFHLEDTLADVLDHWRAAVRSERAEREAP